MKSSTSTLNPYAASYVPLFKREVNEDKTSKTLSGQSAVSDAQPNVDGYKLKGQQADAADGVSSENSQEDSKFMDEESEMDLAYLQMIFPGVSDQSLADVYHVNRGDLDSAVEMLTHLESADNLPDVLDIEQPEKPVSPGQCSSVKAANVTGESSSSSFPSESAVAT
ncbi:polyadenylate-binding protein-interacting protein 6 [Beta vulgaris subsp. vulgaris]|uniref:polyadenylate-binding protein-interacting protein 6 n=1 Tax=Beta vulgaris subsp. vulgaris TaxID=3555 RepID=UPI0020374D16|nr:polyadenylate-binding protein-interacting protein 6 [Beta vulgaris subsp. vulgaris]